MPSLAPVTRVVRPEGLQPAELDAYLARGWYRIGQSLVTCSAQWFDEGLHSTIWLRTPLEGWRPTRNQRRRLGRLQRELRWEVGPARADAEHERLYQAYLTVARFDRAPTLRHVLGLQSGAQDLFNTWSVRFYHHDELVAFSWFDLGADSVQSVIGVYAPPYRARSLGFFSMLLEAQWAQAQGLRFHYSGYVLPGHPAMDYKLRLKPIEFWSEHQQSWQSWRGFVPEEAPVRRLNQALTAGRAALFGAGIRSQVLDNLHHQLPAWNPHLQGRLLDQPRFLFIAPSWLIAWDLGLGGWSLMKGGRTTAYGVGPSGEELPGTSREVFMIRPSDRLYPSFDEVLAALRRV